MPSYSGGNRWVGVLALKPPPVPPPLHEMARHRIVERSRGSSYIEIRRKRISVETAERALSLLGRILGAHDDLLRQATCFALARSLRRSKTRPETWPDWAQNAVLTYADRPLRFDLQIWDLKEWRLGSSRRAEAVKDKPHEVPRKPAGTPIRRTTTPHAKALSTRASLNTDIVDVVSPVLLDPGEALDDLPLDRGLELALTEAGWPCNSVLMRRWLRLAVMHSSYLYEHQNDLLINSELLRMLDSLGSRWCRLYTLESFISREPRASADEQHRVWAGYSAPMTEYLAEYLHVGQAILLGRGEALTSRDPQRRKRTYGSVTGQVIGAICLLGGHESVSMLAKSAYQKVVTWAAPAANWLQILNIHCREADLSWEYRKSGPDHQLMFDAKVSDRRGRTGRDRQLRNRVPVAPQQRTLSASTCQPWHARRPRPPSPKSSQAG